ncbi:MAG: tRNA pseudouridine(38-40) synthase TruA [Candidatus Omnitrophica bacterium]|nr:tRNA pseudouridine(38-40) synthase TruA [Candidatus Omnitrophota bacterium]
MTKRNIKLIIEYDGTKFNGWQIQAQKSRTVQGEIEKVLKKIFKQKIGIAGSGRTDSGVHAKGQVAHFLTTSDMPHETIRNAVNGNLPRDIAILDAQEMPLKFHARFSTKRKTYRYTVLNRAAKPALEKNFSLHHPQKLNIRKMRREAGALIGKKDFRSFMASDSAQRDKKDQKNTVRHVYRLDITKKEEHVFFDIEANGFLYKMVRNIVGTLLTAGTEKLPDGSMKSILQQKNRNCAAKTAPAHGLCLWEVTY